MGWRVFCGRGRIRRRRVRVLRSRRIVIRRVLLGLTSIPWRRILALSIGIVGVVTLPARVVVIVALPGRVVEVVGVVGHL